MRAVERSGVVPGHRIKCQAFRVLGNTAFELRVRDAISSTFNPLAAALARSIHTGEVVQARIER